MEWVFWITAMSFMFTLILFTYLYSFTDVEFEWPPCVSELIESHKAPMIVMFGFTSGLIWLNLIIISLIVRMDELVMLSTVIYFSVMGVFAFDLNHFRGLHYLFVTMYTISSFAYANIVVSDSLYCLTFLVNLSTVLFVFMVVYTARDMQWEPTSKYFYTGFECIWLLSFFVYTLAHAFQNRHAYSTLLLLVNCTSDTTHEQGLHTLLG